MKYIVLLLGCLVLMPPGAQAGELYRWVDANGKVHYGDAPPVDAAQIEVRKFSDAVVPNEDLPYETYRAQQNFPVILYVADNCAEYCAQARNLLSKRGIPFTEKKLQTQEELDAFKALSGFDSVPVLSVGKAFLRGFLATQWHSELDIAGYPKIAPYRPTSTLHAPAETSAPPVPVATGEAEPVNPEFTDGAAPASEAVSNDASSQ